LPDPRNSYSLLLDIPWLEVARAIIEFDKDGRFLVKLCEGDETITIPKHKMGRYKKPTSFYYLLQIGRRVNQ
jgi:hypothetical protein